jgi:hypothetical protein
MIGNNIWQNPFLRNTLIVSLALASVLPVYDVLFIYPSFTKFLIESTKDQAVSVARHLASTLISEKSDLDEASPPEDLLRGVKKLKTNFELKRLKVFSKSGEVLFSTDIADIGKVNNQKYLRDVITLGNVHSKFIHRDAESLEGQKIAADVVETYVPIVSAGKVLGAFEIYYDITARKKQLDKLLSRSSVTVFTLAFVLLIVIVILLFKENKTIVERKIAEDERIRLIAELRKALAEVKTLSGMLPICSSCKKIRDDKGYWKQIETYIAQHSKASFTHSICPDCVKKLYPNYIKEDDS